MVTLEDFHPHTEKLAMALENELFVREEWEGGDRSGVGRYYKYFHCGGIKLKLDYLKVCPLQVIRFKAATHTKYLKYFYHFLSLNNQSEQANCS